MIFFTDENIPKWAAYMLDIFDRDHNIRASVDYFDEGTKDEEWIRAVARWDDPVAVCGDGRILKNRAERRVLKECGLMFVFLARGWTNLPWPDYAWKIVKVWPAIVKNVRQVRYPVLFEVTPRLKIQLRCRISDL